MPARPAIATRLEIVADPKLRSCPRVEAVRDVGAWLVRHGGLCLPPRAVIVDVRRSPLLRGRLAGRFLVLGEQEGGFPDEFVVLVAMGRETDEDDDGFASRLVSVAHEFVHVESWVRAFGDRTPAEMVMGRRGGEMMAWLRHEDEDITEARARRLGDRYFDEYPGRSYQPECRPACACRARAR